jgi:DNA-binding NtrC family response regulator
LNAAYAAARPATTTMVHAAPRRRSRPAPCRAAGRWIDRAKGAAPGAEGRAGAATRRRSGYASTAPGVKRDAIVRSLEENGGNKQDAAQALGMSRATIYRKMKDYGIA